ncbi:tail fiber domain-containing protein [Dyadobacter sp. CY343]|uniref:tail fiber domain-containing protein n=1 Tax=Dyadobacter sp. CY343 TaxID=2907299 RepID=UPI001F44DB01|nr:tail fiber domain-containing protein [Dyadobacter sp. CY343]MCE7060088.1 tail fiber domain-containing protein [Dyadobacter sp. CY343]
MKNQYTFMRKMLFKLQWKICCLLCLVSLIAPNVQAQAPNQFSFQGVARDAAGKVIANGNVTLWVMVKSTTSPSPDPNPVPNAGALFEEILEATTNEIGVFSIHIGSTGANLASIDWDKGPYYLQIFIDPSGGNNLGDYVDLGFTQLVSVPYALMANKLPEMDPISQVGVFGEGKTLDNFSTSPRLTWYPRKDAFKVGTGVTNENSFGEHSVALGNFSIASANKSTALGLGTIANVEGGTVLGSYNNIPLIDFEGNQDDRLLQIGNGTSDDNRNNALTMMGDGKIGIGNNVLNPKYLLDIGGRARIKHNGETAGIYFNNSANVESGFVGMKTDEQVGLFIGGKWQFWVNADGDGFLKGNIIQTSDRRLKHNFSPVANSLSKLTHLTGQHYFWKDNAKSQELQTGLIAQEVEQYFPELVTTDDKGFKAVNYIGLIPHLIESVKTLKAQTEVIGALEKKLESVTARETQMRDEIKASLLRELRSELSNIKAANNSNQQTK